MVLDSESDEKENVESIKYLSEPYLSEILPLQLKKDFEKKFNPSLM